MFENLFTNIFRGNREVPLDSKDAAVEIKNGGKRSDKYDSDVKALRERYGIKFKSGLCIEISLKEAMILCPRARRRVDAYTGLIGHLKREYGVELVINSQKINNYGK